MKEVFFNMSKMSQKVVGGRVS